MVKGVVTAGLFSALASALGGVECVYADGPLNFAPFSTSSTSNSQAPGGPGGVGDKEKRVESEDKVNGVKNDHPRTTSAGFDPEALERGAKALKEINKSSYAKQVFFIWLLDEFMIF